MLILAAHLPRPAFEVSLLLLSERGDLAGEAEALGIPVHLLGLLREDCRGMSPRCALTVAQALRRYVRLTRGIDVVDAWLVPAFTFAGLAQPVARVPVLLAGRRATLDVHRSRSWPRDAAWRFAMRQVHGVVANSQVAASEAIWREGIDPGRVHVVPNAVVPVALEPAERLRLRRAWGFGPDDIVVGCVANFHPGKGHELLLEVATSLRDRRPRVRYAFVGNGALRPWLEEEIRRRNLGDLIALHSGEPDARRLYGAFDIALQASESEGLPNAVLEAAAAGLPIVATAVGGTAEILTSGENGILVPKRDSAALGAAVARLSRDPVLRERLGVAARLRSRDYSPERLADATASIYLRLAAGRVRRSAARADDGGEAADRPAPA
jgi:glycosyltransferase involved in cell wall biosynthesis